MDTLLEMKNVHKNFGGVQAINDFSVRLETGTIHGLIGPNGAGKTTIFNTVTGIYRPTQGDIFFCGDSIITASSHKIAQIGIARTFQNIRLFSNMTILENVLIASHVDARYNLLTAITHIGKFKESEKALERNAIELLESFGFAGNLDEKAMNLPYGHQRKLEICRAIATRPKLLLLDEPAAGMNADECEELVEFVSRIKDQYNLTILLIEHHMDVVSNLCEHVTVLNFGKTIAEGTPDEIKQNQTVIGAYLGEGA